MQEAETRRIFLACGTVLLALLAWAMVALLGSTGPEGAAFVLSGIAFLGALLILVLTGTMLFSSAGGTRGLRAAAALLWVSFALIAVAFAFLFVGVLQYL